MSPATPSTSLTRHIDRAAVADAVPLFIPAIPFGLVVGVAIIESTMPTTVGWSTSPVIFAGASQLATVTLAGVTASWAVIVAALVINSRHVMYSAALAPTFTDQPRWFRWFAPFFLIDQVFALVATRTHWEPERFRHYYFNISLFFYVTWAFFVTLGMILGPVIPSEWRLDVAPAVMFTGMVVISLVRWPAIVAAATAALVALAAAGLRDRLGILVGAAAGVIAGAIAETISDRRAVTDSVAVDDGGDSG